MRRNSAAEGGIGPGDIVERREASGPDKTGAAATRPEQYRVIAVMAPLCKVKECGRRGRILFFRLEEVRRAF